MRQAPQTALVRNSFLSEFSSSQGAREARSLLLSEPSHGHTDSSQACGQDSCGGENEAGAAGGYPTSIRKSAAKSLSSMSLPWLLGESDLSLCSSTGQLLEDSHPADRGTSQGMKHMLPLTCGTLALVAIWVINALGPIQTGSAGAVIDVNLAHRSREALRRQGGDTNQRLSHLPLLKQWAGSLAELMPLSHQADGSPCMASAWHTWAKLRGQRHWLPPLLLWSLEIISRGSER